MLCVVIEDYKSCRYFLLCNLVCKLYYECILGMVTLRAAAGSRGPPPRRPGRSNMDLRQTAVNALSYQLDRAPKLRPPERRQRGSEPWSANVHAAPGPAAGWTKRSSGLVGGGWPSAKQVSSTPNQPHRGFRPTKGSDQDGSDRDVVGSHRVTTFSSLRLRVAQHSTYRLAAET